MITQNNSATLGRSNRRIPPCTINMKTPLHSLAVLREGMKARPEAKEWLVARTITGEPNELVARIHTRTPVIPPEGHHAKWLGEAEDGDLKALLKPFPAERMRIWEISPRVNSPENNDQRIIEPIPDNIGDWKLAGS